MLVIGYDVGSSSVKASVLDIETGVIVGSAFAPKTEMEIKALKSGWAEQEPELWWTYLKEATREVLSGDRVRPDRIRAAGISYQMHGLVVIDKDRNVLRPAIIWCDSRAVEIGDKAAEDRGRRRCFEHMLNSPGNFTASKLKWVMVNEPQIYRKAYKIMLPGDYVAMKMTRSIRTRRCARR